jgi:hypothetical protein
MWGGARGGAHITLNTMDAYLKDYLKLSSYGEFIGELIFPSVRNEKQTKAKTKSYSLRGLGRYKPTYNVISENSDLDKLRLNNPGPIRGLGRVGGFYKALSEKLKSETFTISEKKYNYWRGLRSLTPNPSPLERGTDSAE